MLVLMALIPKTDGGRRPIVLLPLLPRIWMRARHSIVQAWERSNDRDYLYAGPGKGALVATWKQAARAEIAKLPGKPHAQVVLDLAKAFERVPYAVLLREAKMLGYNLAILRLSIATYRLGRVVRVDGGVGGRSVPDARHSCGICRCYCRTELADASHH